MDDLMPHIARFLETIQGDQAEFDRVLSTVLFTDIVGSTKQAAAMGDRAWHSRLDGHHRRSARCSHAFADAKISTAGDGFLATFDGPAGAVRCARSIVEAVKPLGVEIRAGCHTGEVELDDGVRGMAVNIGSRVGALAGPSEVLVSSTVKDLVAGSGPVFEDAAEHELKGVPDRARLYRVAMLDSRQ
jgi:class 3 adenylate cyclase